MQNPDEAIENYQLAKKDREREQIIAAAKEAGYGNRRTPMICSTEQEEVPMRIFAVILFLIGLGTFTVGAVQGALLDMALGTCCMLLAAGFYPSE